ncbi:3789_t:CDS:2 [Acaulospora colombiana]|uniref:3789_t:CDS:1 n=1 Tax=Acaulospora colombiana TaxID=27376 RepID=A0ACA9LBS5_9GLOM|nr:3789_t:CDS:2 [Acaulospora colombiana]
MHMCRDSDWHFVDAVDRQNMSPFGAKPPEGRGFSHSTIMLYFQKHSQDLRWLDRSSVKFAVQTPQSSSLDNSRFCGASSCDETRRVKTQLLPPLQLPSFIGLLAQTAVFKCPQGETDIAPARNANVPGLLLLPPPSSRQDLLLPDVCTGSIYVLYTKEHLVTTMSGSMPSMSQSGR